MKIEKGLPVNALEKQALFSVRWVWKALVVGCCLFLIAGCSGQPILGVSSPTQTAQAMQISSLATQMAGNHIATQSAGDVQAAATAQALIDIHEEAKNWPVVFSDTFDDDANEWPTGPDEGDLSTTSIVINNGKYTFTGTAKEGFIYWTTPKMEDIQDFYLTVEGVKKSGPEDSDYGIVFRMVDNQDYYVFKINDQSNYSMDAAVNTEWSTLIDWKHSDAIQPGQVNKIAILAVGSHFIFYVNDQLIDQCTDTNFSNGTAGVVIGLYTPGDSGNFEFDNFVIRSPQPPAVTYINP